ncbi:PREDICTED: methyltransferase-like protein 17, mitochondrial [Dinoponera quadriceps]|uniref:Methyltransferase-like protein 17, mitochondrial n=1 Tax=Dinoponera quadriceps TaxID=609295 RepID=A0A6P3Y7Z5_DINQU|nr:PREDICTED: methyltransferase-like protein 17, mitochondrial [Dinoponera quadriceps]XP_014486135.1 PREDICTED: methyltransferase-like protein 17, mitochondrial [Dinoponera quadriceps]
MGKLVASRIRFMTFTFLRHFSAKPKTTPEMISSLVFNEDLKHRNHPGIIKPRTPTFPEWTLKEISNILADHQISLKEIKESAEKLLNHLNGRHQPIQEAKLYEKLLKVEKCLNVNKDDDEKVSIEDIDFKKNRRAKLLLKQNVYNWQPINFDKLTCLTYMVGRIVQHYAVSHKILKEIRIRDEDFKPQTLFDFGSGLGTVTWAASEIWPNSLKEYLCIETSKPMIELSERLAKVAKPKIKNIFHREYFPASPNPTYDIVVSAYSLFELPGTESRLETILKLWQKTERYLIIVEQGTNAGFELVNEARDLVLRYTKSKYRRGDQQNAYVFSPCPHDLKCPRFGEKTPCNFNVLYHPLPFLKKPQHKSENYSYVVLKKDKRPENDEQWPRIVRATLCRGKHTICRMCVASGELREEIFTKWKHGRDVYRCARNSKWGDRLPIHYKELEDIPEGNDTGESAVE